MKISNVARLIFSLAIISAIAVLVRAESSNRRTTAPQKPRSAQAIRIFDQNGLPAVSGMPSGGQTFDVAVGQTGFTFDPDELNISVGDTVRWTWFSNNHSVTSGSCDAADSQFCSPDYVNCADGILSNTGTGYEHAFSEAGAFSYLFG